MPHSRVYQLFERFDSSLLPLTLAFLVAACGNTGRSAVAGGSKRDCEKVAHLLNPAGRLQAMVSIHANAFGAEHQRVLELTQAASVLACDARGATAGARSRKRRAVAELVGYGRLERFDQPIRTLGADLQEIRRAVRARYPYTFWYLLANPAVLELVVSNLIAEDPSLGGLPRVTPAKDDPPPDCESTWREEEPFAVWHVGPTITVDGKVSVTAQVDAVEKNMDGQRWDECSPFWDPPPHATELVEKQPGGGFAAIANAPAPGSEYGPDTLFEHFECGVSGCLAWFENRLRVQNNRVSSLPTQPSLAGYVVSYSLPTGGNLGGCIGGTGKNCAGGTNVKVLTDQGWLEVYKEKNRTMVVTHKEVKLDNAVANGISQALLAYAELARELAEQACCLKAAP
jgi:hypothetical protein